MKRVQIGDVFEIETPKGRGYFKYVYINVRNAVELIRVIPGLYSEELENMAGLVSPKEAFYVQFPVKAAYWRKIVRLIGNYEVLAGLELPPKQMRTTHIIRGEFICWHIVDYETLHITSVKELTDEQKKLSPWGIWNDTLLIEKLVEGWMPEDGEWPV